MQTIWIIIVVYMLAMIGIGLYAKTKIKSSVDYHLAGRRLGPIMLAGTLAATEIGGGSSVGVTAKAYGAWGLSAGWYVVATGMGIFLVSFIAPRMRRAMATTVPEIIGRRYGKSSQAITSVVALIALIGLAAAQIVATATIVNVLTGFDMHWAVIISGLIVVFYTWIGGMWSVTLTDFVQFFFIIFGFAIAVPFALNNLHGISALNWEQITAGWQHVQNTVPEEKFEWTKLGWPTIAGLTVMYFMTFSTGQEAVQRYYAARNERVAITGSLLCSALITFYAFIPAVLGLISFAAFPGIKDSSALATLSVNLLPPFICGILLSAIISATLSSASGDLLGAASICVKDIIPLRRSKAHLTGEQELHTSRVLVIATGVLAIGIALFSQDIIGLLVFSFTLRATGPFAAYILGLTWEKVTPGAGIWSIIAGLCVGLFWELIKGEKQFGVMSIIVGSMASLVVFLSVVWIERNKGIPFAPSAFQNNVDDAETTESEREKGTASTTTNVSGVESRKY